MTKKKYVYIRREIRFTQAEVKQALAEKYHFMPTAVPGIDTLSRVSFSLMEGGAKDVMLEWTDKEELPESLDSEQPKASGTTRTG